jgi:hypothetical protein
MRRALGFILPVVVCAGCFSFGNRQPDAAGAADAGAPTGDRDRTLEYWGKLRGVMGERTKSDNLRALTNIVQKQVDVVRNQPTEGVDAELVAAAEALAKSQEKVVELAEIADFRFEALRVPQVAKEFARANQQAGAATARLKALRAKLSARYGVNFPPLDG